MQLINISMVSLKFWSICIRDDFRYELQELEKFELKPQTA